MWKSSQKRLSLPNLKVAPSFQSHSQQKLLGLGNWHSEREVLTPMSGRVALDSTKSRGDCCSLGLLWETGKQQTPDVQHLAALADAELGSQWKATPAGESVLPIGEAASQLFLSSVHQHHSLSKVEN